MLKIAKRQEYLKYLGFYSGSVDGIVGPKTKQAYKDLQNKYFTRDSDKDGIYGKNTDILLQNAYNVKRLCKNFDLTEFRCGCNGKYCTGYPTLIDTNLMKNIQSVRDHTGSTTITSGLRCQAYNDSLTGSVKNSRHVLGKAVDFVNAGTKTLDLRKSMITYWFKLSKPNYSYCNGWYRSGNVTGSLNASYMGNAIHADVK